MTKYPFPLPDHLLSRLPLPDHERHHYVDVFFRGHWDGVLVIDHSGKCIGVYFHGQIEECPLPFDAAEIENVRPASFLNRMLAIYPFDLYDACCVLIVFVSPIFIVLALLLHASLSAISVVLCIVSTRGMYSVPGFPFTRLPVAVIALAQIIVSMVILLREIRI